MVSEQHARFRLAGLSACQDQVAAGRLAQEGLLLRGGLYAAVIGECHGIEGVRQVAGHHGHGGASGSGTGQGGGSTGFASMARGALPAAFVMSSAACVSMPASARPTASRASGNGAKARNSTSPNRR